MAIAYNVSRLHNKIVKNKRGIYLYHLKKYSKIIIYNQILSEKMVFLYLYLSCMILLRTETWYKTIENIPIKIIRKELSQNKFNLLMQQPHIDIHLGCIIIHFNITCSLG